MKSISKWNDFLINENFKLILEANLELMPKLMKTLNKMKSPVAKFILSLNNQDLETDINLLDVDINKAGDISYYPQKKIDNSDELWTIINNGECYSGWSRGCEFFQIENSLSYPDNGLVGKIINQAKYSDIINGSSIEHIVCHFQTLEGDNIIIGKSGLKKHNSIEKYQQSGKSARVINKILKLVGKEFTPKDIENFSNEFKSVTSQTNFELVKGEDIRYWYDGDNYTPNGGTLNSSCMRYSSCQKYLDIYVKNPDVCQLLILKNEDNPELIDARALVWKLDDGNTFMDRVYYTSDHMVDMFIDYAKKNDWYFKSIQNWQGKIINKENNELDEIYVNVLDKSNYEYFPYMDTIKYWNNKETMITTVSFYSSAMESTDGGDGTCEHCDGEGRVECYDCYGSGSNRCSCCDGDIPCSDCEGEGEIECGECDGSGEIDEESCPDCNGKGKIECEECGGDGSITCSDCEGEGKIECEECGGDGTLDCPECS